jgi:arylsulfatase A-like enzyme
VRVGWEIVLVWLVASTPSASFAATVDAARPDPPNFVIVVADDLGYGDVGFYGNASVRTPRLDGLAEAGMRFTDFHSSGTVCSPTRAGLLTGRYQHRAGLPLTLNADPSTNRHHGLHPEEVTFPELLRAEGYATALFGKWHLGYDAAFHPLQHGFDEFRGFISGNIDYVSHYDRLGAHDWWDGKRRREESGYATHLVTEHALRFIAEHEAKPFVLVVSYPAPHEPYQGPGDPPVRGPRARPAPREPERIAQTYRRMVAALDEGIGRIVDALDQRGLGERTLVWFLSDNGANRHGSNLPWRGSKGSVWEGGHRVPAIVRWPGVVPAGRRSDALAASLDVMPTLLALAGMAAPDGHELDGHDLSARLRGAAPAPARTLFWGSHGEGAVRRGPWKLVLNPAGRRGIGLYDLDVDPGELANLASEQPERVAELRAALVAWWADVAEGATLQPGAAAQPERRSSSPLESLAARSAANAAGRPAMAATFAASRSCASAHHGSR